MYWRSLTLDSYKDLWVIVNCSIYINFSTPTILSLHSLRDHIFVLRSALTRGHVMGTWSGDFCKHRAHVERTVHGNKLVRRAPGWWTWCGNCCSGDSLIECAMRHLTLLSFSPVLWRMISNQLNFMMHVWRTRKLICAKTRTWVCRPLHYHSLWQM